MKITKRPGRAAFTLIELMAVITIIVILAGLVVGGLGYVTDKQATSKAKVQIALLSTALEAYKNDMGQYPLTGNLADPKALSALSLYSALFYEGYDYSKNPTQAPSTPAKATKIYLPDLDPTATKQGWMDPVTGTNPQPPAPNAVKTPVKDPWGNEYRYRSAQALTGTTPNSNTQNPDFDLWSVGKDGLTGAPATAKDDIKNY